MSDSTGGGGMIPESRFSEVISERNEARAKLAQLEQDLAKANARNDRLVEKHAQTVEEMQTQHQEQLLKLEVNSALGDIDDEDVRDLLIRKHQRLEPEEGQEAPSFTEWFREFKASEPTILKPYLKAAEPEPSKPAPAPAAPAPAQASAAPPKPAQPAQDPTVNAGPTQGDTPDLSKLTPQQLAQMPKEQLDAMGGMQAVIRARFGSS